MVRQPSKYKEGSMGKIIVSNFISVDGLFADKNDSTEWVAGHHHAIDEYSKQQLTEAGAILFGEKTYSMMSQYWPTPLSEQEDETIRDRMNNLKKIVFSESLENPEWENTIVVRSIDKAQIEEKKASANRDMLVFGSGSIVRQLLDLGLIDELRLFIMPIILAEGRPLFEDVQPHTLELLEQREFPDGVILLRYAPGGQKHGS